MITVPIRGPKAWVADGPILYKTSVFEPRIGITVEEKHHDDDGEGVGEHKASPVVVGQFDALEEGRVAQHRPFKKLLADRPPGRAVANQAIAFSVHSQRNDIFPEHHGQGSGESKQHDDEHLQEADHVAQHAHHHVPEHRHLTRDDGERAELPEPHEQDGKRPEVFEPDSDPLNLAEGLGEFGCGLLELAGHKGLMLLAHLDDQCAR